MDFHKIKFILNPRAGRKGIRRKILATVNKILASSTLAYHIELTQCKGDGTRIAREALAEGYDLMVAIGGDGTINEVASALIHTPTLLGIIPTGSGNALAHELGLPMHISGAVRLITEKKGRVKELDVGWLPDLSAGPAQAGRYFLSTLGIGYDAYVAKLFNEYGKERRGLLPYFYLALKAFLQYRPQLITLKFQGQDIRDTFFLVAVANIKQYGGGAIIAPQASPYDALLDICLIRQVKFWQFLYHWPKLFTGTIDKVAFLETCRTPTLEISLPPNTPYQLDGESFSDTSILSVSVLPRALKLYAP